jgi:hypothetical protein
MARYLFQRTWLGEPELLEEQIWLLRQRDRRVAAAEDSGPAGDEARRRTSAALEAARDSIIVCGLADPLVFFAISQDHQRQIVLARGALRVHRHRLLSGALPEKLVDFADTSWPPSPDLCFGGGGVAYERTRSGFLLRDARWSKPWDARDRRIQVSYTSAPAPAPK